VGPQLRSPAGLRQGGPPSCRAAAAEPGTAPNRRPDWYYDALANSVVELQDSDVRRDHQAREVGGVCGRVGSPCQHRLPGPLERYVDEFVSEMGG
jgi:hypothetical protein